MALVDEPDGKRLASGVRGWERDRREAGENRRTTVARAVADLIVEIGPAAITHRKVAARAEASLSATSYYFKDLTALMGAGAAMVFGDWLKHSEDEVAKRLSDIGPIEDGAEALMAALYPPGSDVAVRRQFELLTMTHRLTGCSEAFAQLQEQFVSAADRILDRLKLVTRPPTASVIATVLGFGLQESCQQLAPFTLAPALGDWLGFFTR